MNNNKKWLILAVSIVINLCIGFAYAWSVFSKPLQIDFGWTPSQASMAFTINLFVLPIAMIFAGPLVKRFGVRVVVLLGGVFGLFPSITADNFGIKHLSMNYGVVMTGLSIGAFIGPQIAAYAVEQSGGSYNLAFIITLGINIAAIILVLFAKRMNAKHKMTLATEN